jgi:gas vesicle protein
MRNDHYSSDSNGSISPMAMGFLAGLVAGSAAAMLFAPYSGPDVRRRLRDGIATGKERAEEWVQEGKRKLSEEASRLDTALQAGREAYMRSGDRGDA